MKPVQIDFAPRQGWMEAGTDKRRRPLWAALSLLLLLLLVASLTSVWKLQRERSAVNVRVAALQTELEVSQEGEAHNESATAESADSVRQANMHLNFPWVSMLGTLEHVSKPEITLVSLEMGVLRQSSKIVIEAGDGATALGFLESLREEPAYAAMALTRQEAATTDGAAHMRFTLEAPAVQPEPQAKKTGAS